MKVLKITLVATIILVTCLSFAACTSADESKISADGVWQYVEVEGGVSLTAVKKMEADMTVPATVDGKTVVSLGEKLFIEVDDGSAKKSNAGVYRENTTLKTLTILADIKEIPNMCFYYCTALEEVVFPDSLESVAPFAFFNCSALKSVTLPEKTNSIGEYSFRQCLSLETVTINYAGDACVTIGDKAFYNLDEKVSKDEQYFINPKLTIYVKNIELYDADALEAKRIETKEMSYKYWEEYVKADIVKQK